MKDLKVILYGCIPVVFQQIFFSDKMIEISTYWATTILTLSILGVVYYLYFRLRYRLKKLYELIDTSTDYLCSISKANVDKYENDREEIRKGLLKLGANVKYNEDKAIINLHESNRKKMKKIEDKTAELFENF